MSGTSLLTFLIGFGAAMAGGGAELLYAQIYPSSSYSDYAKRRYDQTRMIAPTFSARQYTVDRVFYHDETISPYLNLLRPQGGGSEPNYFSTVKPELQRRAAEVRSNLPANLQAVPQWAKPPQATAGQAPNSALAKYYRAPY